MNNLVHDPSMWLAFAAALTAGVVGLVRIALHRRDARTWLPGSRYVTIAAPPEVDPRGAAALWTHLGAISRSPWQRFWFGQPHVVFEYRFCGAEMTVRIWVPTPVSAGVVADAVQAAWPGAKTETTDAEPPLPEEDHAAGGRLVWSGTAAEPVTADAPVDPLRGLIAAGLAGRRDAVALVQVSARPASPRETRLLRRAADGAQRRTSLIDEILDLFTLTGPKTTATIREPATLTRYRRAAAERSGGLLWSVGLRWAVTGNTASGQAAEAAASRLGGAAAALTGAAGIRRRRMANLAGRCNTWVHDSAITLTCNETGALAHLPSDEVVPAMERAGARTVAAPVHAVNGGRNTKTLGIGPDGRRLAIRVTDARHHMHIVGPTGSGKSVLLHHMIMSDIRARRPVVVIDPKGDLVNDVVDSLDPDTAKNRLVLIDPSAPGPHPGLDPLAGADSEVVIDQFTGICRRIWERHWGPRADDILRNALRTLFVAGDPALRHLPSLLTNKAYRAPLIAGIDDPMVLGGFWTWFDQLSPTVQSQAAGPVLSRIRALLGHEFVRDTIGSPERGFDLEAALNTDGIVLARLPKGQLGDDTARLLGSVLTARVWQAASARARIPENKRRDATLYLDEFQNFLNLPYAVEDMLAEARGLHLGMVLAHQHWAQLDRPLQFAVAANARTKAYFATSAEDAHLLARHTAPNLSEHDLEHLPAYTIAARPFTGGRTLPACTLTTLPPETPIGQGESIRAQAAAHPAFTPHTTRSRRP
ncbi:type IV secretory system conjugative DNA transfer family protein [Glycomyces buryatensis]|uniref:DUF87 domain-containing protein n=1 Tax=Glycomyces buryatensis TaxID=2570927 RepID=A0A4S8PVV7_9ACTN|nr:type IV secretion system DNA-binding domain-containing protein [Glycomyces buryatensis]THV35710.1 DUF87 domain-containing protein [Glycomyces buryatensis]